MDVIYKEENRWNILHLTPRLELEAVWAGVRFLQMAAEDGRAAVGCYHYQAIISFILANSVLLQEVFDLNFASSFSYKLNQKTLNMKIISCKSFTIY